MTLGRIIVCLFGLFSILSCGKDDAPTIWIGDYGNNIACEHIVPEKMSSVHNCFFPDEVDTANADLRLFVTGDDAISGDVSNGDKELEKNIIHAIDPDNECEGKVSITIEYTMKVCKSITISLYDKDSVFIADVTDKARFHYIYKEKEGYYQMLINSEKNVLGQIRIGMTIKEYLSYHPFMFVKAHFLFDELDKSDTSDGKFFRTRIELEDGTVLMSDSKEIKV